MQRQQAGEAAGFNVWDLAHGATLLAAGANVVMQLARPEVGHGVVESRVDSAQLMRHPLRRWASTLTYLSVAMAGTDAERRALRRLVNRSHAQVRSTGRSPVSYSAFDPSLQLWVAACLYRGLIDMDTLLRGPASEETADLIYLHARRLGTTLQMPAELWPPGRAEFGRYWEAAVREIRIGPQVRAYLDELIMLRWLPRPVSAVLGPVSRFLTTGFLPPPFREQMQLAWSERDEQWFAAAARAIATADRLLPGPVRRFPFNACLFGLRAGLPGLPGLAADNRLAGGDGLAGTEEPPRRLAGR